MKIDSNKSTKAPDAVFIKNLFSTISGTYDRANDVITFGMARQWRKELVRWSAAGADAKILDCATGTGDLALEFKKTLGPKSSVIGSDFCQDMLNVAPQKAVAADLDVKFELGDVLALNYPSDQFDVTSIAYGIRNVADMKMALKEMARVTKPGGRVMILETGEVDNPVLRRAIQLYFQRIVPVLGGWVSGHRDAYEYLQSSSGQFPSGEEFCDLMKSTGQFRTVEYKSLMGGASFIYKGYVRES